MAQETINIAEYAVALGLVQRAGELFYGWQRGFAMGLKVINPLENPLLLVHVRLGFPADSPEVKAVRYDDPILHVFSPTVAWEALPQVELSLGSFHLGVKIMGAILAVVIAVALAKPKPVGLRL